MDGLTERTPKASHVSAEYVVEDDDNDDRKDAHVVAVELHAVIPRGRPTNGRPDKRIRALMAVEQAQILSVEWPVPKIRLERSPVSYVIKG